MARWPWLFDNIATITYYQVSTPLEYLASMCTVTQMTVGRIRVHRTVTHALSSNTVVPVVTMADDVMVVTCSYPQVLGLLNGGAQSLVRVVDYPSARSREVHGNARLDARIQLALSTTGENRWIDRRVVKYTYLQYTGSPTHVHVGRTWTEYLVKHVPGYKSV